MDAPEGLPAAGALAKVAEGEALTEYEAGTYSTGGRRFEIIIRWATGRLGQSRYWDALKSVKYIFGFAY